MVKTTTSDETPADEADFEPRTELGQVLRECRREIIAAGEPLLDWKGIEREVAERRGGARYAEDQ